MDLKRLIADSIKAGKKPYAPQEGFQTNFLTSPADVVFGGGAAGAGKSSALLMAACRYHQIKYYGAVIFRRSIPEIIQEGGLWDESKIIYPMIGGLPNETRHRWKFPDYGSKITFSHLTDERDLQNFQGSQIPVIGFDELTHFSKKMFIYMLSRNRSAKCKVEPRVYATMNPDPDSWVAEFIEWFIDQATGYPIPSRAGVLRYFIGEQDNIIQGATKKEVIEKVSYIFDDPIFKNVKPEDLIKSFTFIPGLIDDNQELLRKNPGYLANLKAQDEETQLRLLRGNWKIRSDKSSLCDFTRLSDMFENLHVMPGVKKFVTIDHARQGRDLCVIGTWLGWRLVRIDILKQSNTNDIMKVINIVKKFYSIPSSQVLIDQDGIGVQDSMNCKVFQGSRPARPVKINGKTVPTNYKNRRVQNYFLLSEKINNAEIFIDLENCFIHDTIKGTTKQVKMIQVADRIREIKDMIREDLRPVKREDIDAEGKIRITSKEEIKNAIGRSPDFGDMMMMRSEFEFLKEASYLR